jgi:hypothetical protein
MKALIGRQWLVRFFLPLWSNMALGNIPLRPIVERSEHGTRVKTREAA